MKQSSSFKKTFKNIKFILSLQTVQKKKQVEGYIWPCRQFSNLWFTPLGLETFSIQQWISGTNIKVFKVKENNSETQSQIIQEKEIIHVQRAKKKTMIKQMLTFDEAQ